MRIMCLALVVAISGSLGIGLASQVRAQTQTMESPTIAVIDMQEIRRKSKAVQSIERQIKQQKSDYQKKISEKEKQIRKEDKSLSQQRTLLSDQAFKKKRNKLRQKLSQFRQDIKVQRKALDKSYSQAMRKVQRKLIEIVQKVAADRNLDMVLNKAAVVLVRPEMEITDPALKRLNAQLASVDVPAVEQTQQ